MHRIVARAAARLFCALSAATATVEAQPATATPEQYGALPTVSEAAISPDGATVALIQSLGGVRSLAFYSLDGGAATSVKLGDVKARDLVWASDDFVLLLVSSADVFTTNAGLKTYERFRWAAVSRKNSKPRWMLSGDPAFTHYAASGAVLSMTATEPDSVVMAHPLGGALSLYKVRLADGKEESIVDGKPETSEWIVDGVGKPLLRVDYDGDKEQRRFYFAGAGKNDFTLAQTVPEKRTEDAQITTLAVADTDRRFFVRSQEGAFDDLRLFDLGTGARDVVFAPPGRDVGGAVIDPYTDKLAGMRWRDDMQRTHFLDPELAALQERLEKAMPDARIAVTSWSKDRNRFLIRALYPDHPDRFFLHDRAKKSLSMLTPTVQALDGRTAAKKEKYDYVASDGLAIPGYLTVPKGASRKAMPLVVLPHGGPAARDDMSFDWWAFFYAARGYLVYQPNFRGSSGYGKAFETAGYGEWGRKMQSDITEGVRKLIADGVVDEKRICIVGASYGGYAALAGATLTPDLYACAVSVAGISDIPVLIGAEAQGNRYIDEYFAKTIGSRFRNTKELDAVSPATLATNARAPILLMHGKDDIVVPVGQSRIMRNALEKAGKKVTFVELAGEDHWLSSGATRTEMLRRSIDFIDQAIGGR